MRSIEVDTPEDSLERPVILGIVGDSATGKTTLTDGIVKILGRKRVTVISVDDYHSLDRSERAAGNISALDPMASHLDIIEQHLQLLRVGRPILKPLYDHRTGTLGRPEYLEPREFVIAEGLLGFTTHAMRECFDVKIFLDPEEDLRVQWKLTRDVADRGYSRESVLEQIERRNHDRLSYVLPQRAFADVVIEFTRRDEGVADHEELDARHILRPTLPHPDISALLNEDSAAAGLRRHLARDADSKPVDILDISGGISDEDAQQLESLLWNMLPETHRVHPAVGIYFDGTERLISHPLGLTQLLIAFHIVMARQGIHVD